MATQANSRFLALLGMTETKARARQKEQEEQQQQQRPPGWAAFVYCLLLYSLTYWFSRFQLMRSPSVVDEEDELELVWFFDFVSL